MPSLTQRDYWFFAWNAVVGVLCATAVVRDPALQTAAIPPFLWLLIGMGLFEAAALLLWRGVAPLSNVMRFLGLSLALGLYIVIPALITAG